MENAYFEVDSTSSGTLAFARRRSRVRLGDTLKDLPVISLTLVEATSQPIAEPCRPGLLNKGMSCSSLVHYLQDYNP